MSEIDRLLGRDQPQTPTQEVSQVDRLLGRVEPQKQEQPTERIVSYTDEGAPVVNATGYSQNDLTEDKFFKPISNYMRTRFGSQVLENDREEVVNKFLNNMRGFAGGNSVRAINEIAFLNSVEDDYEKRAAAEAYAIYEGMESVFGDTTLGEKTETVWDFVRSGVADPVNLISFGMGKLATSGGVRLTTQAAQQAGRKAVAEAVKKGTLKASAVGVGKKAFQSAALTESTKQAAEIAIRDAIRDNAIKNATARLANKTAWKEIAVTGAVDGVAAAATDYMYQNAMLRTRVQDEYNIYQTGAAALSSLVLMGTVQGASQFVKRGSTVAPELLKTKPKDVNLVALTSDIKKYLDSVKAPTKTDYKRQRLELKDVPSDFFIKMILGDDEKGLQGLAHTLVEQGYAFNKGSDGDYTITRFMGDALRESDPSDFKQFISEYSKVMDIELDSLDGITKEKFADVFVEKMSFSGEMMKAASDTAKMLGTDPKSLTLDDWLTFQLTGEIPRKGLTKSEKIALKGGNLLSIIGVPSGSATAMQNRLIRLLVTNPSTTALNITGYSAATTINSVTDVTRALVSASTQTMKAAVGKGSVKEARKILLDAYANQKFKLANTLDMNTTADMFKRYAQARPSSVREMNRVIPGGVEDINKITSDFDPDQTLVGEVMDKAIDKLQAINLVPAQDTYTKSIEFMTQLDKNLRKEFGMGYTEFFSRNQDEYLKDMITPKYSAAELKAADDTLSAIFSKGFKDPGSPIGELAGFIEDARNIPGLGMLVPFGRFFNNTVAFMADHSFVSLIARYTVHTPTKTTMTDGELIARGAVGWTAAYLMSLKEEQLIDQGYSWSQEPSFDNSGATIDEKYEYPYALFKAAGRVIAHYRRGEEVPEETALDIADTFFGQLTRNLDATGESAFMILATVMSGNGKESYNLLEEAFKGVATQFAAAGTRWVEPFNNAVGLARGEQYKEPDTNQGASAFRQATRYMNQIIDIATGDTMEERFSPAQGKRELQASKSISSAREVEMTDLERVYNLVGIPSWQAGLQTKLPGLKNRYAELYDQLNQTSATALLANQRFRKAPLKDKRALIEDFLEDNKQRVMSYMEAGIMTTDRKISLIRDIDNISSEKELRSAVEDLKFEDDVESLSFEDLYILKTYLETRKGALDLKYSQ